MNGRTAKLLRRVATTAWVNDARPVAKRPPLRLIERQCKARWMTTPRPQRHASRLMLIRQLVTVDAARRVLGHERKNHHV